MALFGSGGAANAAVLTTLAEEGDLIVSDALNHASIVDGCRLSRAAVATYRNADVADLQRVLRSTPCSGRRLIVTDGLFSMDGHAAPLVAIQALARDHGAWLVVDEAHATGVVGPGGAGTAPLLGLANAAPDLVLTGSLSKALGGASGGFAAGPRAAIDRLIAQSRAYIFTMGLTTANAATALAATEVCLSDPGPRERLWSNVRTLRTALEAATIPMLDGAGAIVAIPMIDADAARSASQALTDAGIFAPAVVPPIVPAGDARLRLQVSAAHERESLLACAAILEDRVRKWGRSPRTLGTC